MEPWWPVQLRRVRLRSQARLKMRPALRTLRLRAQIGVSVDAVSDPKRYVLGQRGLSNGKPSDVQSYWLNGAEPPPPHCKAQMRPKLWRHIRLTEDSEKQRQAVFHGRNIYFGPESTAGDSRLTLQATIAAVGVTLRKTNESVDGLKAKPRIGDLNEDRSVAPGGASSRACALPPPGHRRAGWRLA